MSRRITSLLLAVCLFFSIAASGCASVSQPTEPTVPVTESPTEAPTEAPTEPPTEAPTEPPAGVPYLTVSQLTFSVVGECEDIYWGTLPRELVTWHSSDESVVTVENGVVTAVGVGSATISCTYNNQTLECTVSCLAESEEELKTFTEKVLRTPKRIPPVVSDDPITWYDDAAIIGDSITYIMWQWETQYDYLGDVTFFVRGGTSLNGFVLNYKNIYYRGVQMPLEEIIAASGVKKIFLMLGQNDLRYRTLEETMGSWETMTERILEKSPDVEIYIQSLIPEWTKSGPIDTINDKIAEYNILVEQFCEEKGFHFVDVAPYAVDHTGRMPTTYALDMSIHMNEEGCYQWMSLLKSYAYLQENKGDN